MLKGLDHVNIATAKLEETRRFFVDVLGFNETPRPDFGIPGYWLALGGRDLLHLMGVEDGRHEGSIDHFALAVADRDALRTRLKTMNVPFGEFSLPDGSRTQFMLKDPNGVTVELTWRAG